MLTSRRSAALELWAAAVPEEARKEAPRRSVKNDLCVLISTPANPNSVGDRLSAPRRYRHVEGEGAGVLSCVRMTRLEDLPVAAYGLEDIDPHRLVLVVPSLDL